jgi:hypothetical protein
LKGITKTYSYNQNTKRWEYNTAKSQEVWTAGNCGTSSLSIGTLDFGYPSTECKKAITDAAGKDVYVLQVVYEMPGANNTTKRVIYTTYTYLQGTQYRNWYNPSTNKVWGNPVTR